MGWPQPDAEQVATALAWLRDQDPRLSLQVLAGSLRGAGYGADVVGAAVAARQADLDAALPPGSDQRRTAAALLIVAFFGTWAALSFLLMQPHANGGSYGFGQAAAMVLGVILALILLVSLIGVAASGRLRRGVAGAMAVVLAVPFILLVIVAGLCVVSTNGLTI
jgi:hypothetical protein